MTEEKKKTKRHQSIAQQMRRIAEKLAEFATDFDSIDSEKYYYFYDLANKLQGLRLEASVWIPRLMNKGYLVLRENDPECYYLFTSCKAGRKFKRLYKTAQ